MKISMIIPVFNGAGFIENAYQQLLDQNLSDFEIVFVDNNSTDDSIAIINQIKSRDTRVVLLREKIQGAAAARNKGLTYAKGDYIYFFDVDDELFYDALNVLKDVLENHEDIDSVFGNSIKSRNHIKDVSLPNETLKVSIKDRCYWGIRWMNYGTLPGTPSFLHRKSVFDKIGHFNTALRLGEDAAFMVKLGMECRVAYIDKYIMLYYRHADSTVSKQNKVQPHKVFTYWEPLIKEHIPYYSTHETPLEFKKKILIRAYGYPAKMIALTKGFNKRCELKATLISQIRPIKTPVLHRPFISLIVLTGNINVYKMYFYYVVKPWIQYVVT